MNLMYIITIYSAAVGHVTFSSPFYAKNGCTRYEAYSEILRVSCGKLSIPVSTAAVEFFSLEPDKIGD